MPPKKNKPPGPPKEKKVLIPVDPGAIALAAFENRPDDIHSMIDEGSDGLMQRIALADHRDLEGSTLERNRDAPALFIATRQGNVEAMDALLKCKASINLQQSTTGATALIVATQAGQLEVMGKLLEAKASVHKGMHDGSTPIIIAAEFNHPQALALLATHRPQLHPNFMNQQRNDGMSALMTAAYFNHLDCVRLLLALGVNAALADEHGNTAVSLAYQGSESQEVMDNFAQFGDTTRNEIRVKMKMNPKYRKALG